MNKVELMTAAAINAMDSIMNLTSSDNILILTDVRCSNIATAFKQAGFSKGCKVDVYRIDERLRPIKEIPAGLISLLPGKTIVLNIIKALAEEIQFRIKWIFKVKETGRIKWIVNENIDIRHRDEWIVGHTDDVPLHSPSGFEE